MASDKGYSMFLTRLSAELRNWAATTWIWVLGQANHDLEFMLHKLRQNELELGKTMFSSLSYRVEQLRNEQNRGFGGRVSVIYVTQNFIEIGID